MQYDERGLLGLEFHLDFAPKSGGVQPLVDPIVEWPHMYEGEVVGVVAIRRLRLRG